MATGAVPRVPRADDQVARLGPESGRAATLLATGVTGLNGPTDPSATVEGMTEVSGNDRIDDVTPGDIIAVARGAVEQPCKVVFKDFTDDRYLVTLEGDGGETFQLDMASGTTVKRSLASKWESAQSPTPRAGS